MMAKIYDYETYSMIEVGLTHAQAFQMAKRIADDRGHPVILIDDDGDWIVHEKINGCRHRRRRVIEVLATFAQ